MRILSLLIFTLLLLGGAQPARAEAPSRFDLVWDADKAMNEGRWADAESLLLDALHSEPANPTNVMLISNLGMAQFYQGKDDEALSTLTDAVNIAPESKTIRENRARVLTALGHFEQADADYLVLIEADSTLVEPRFYHAMLSLRMGRNDEAEETTQALERLAPDSDEARIARATIHVSRGEYAPAIPLYTRILESRPEAEYYGQRALCRLMTDDLHGASEDIGAALELDPGDAELYLYRAVLRKLQYRPKEAEEDGKRALAHGIDPRRVEALLK